MKKATGILIVFLLILSFGFFATPKQSHAAWSIGVGIGVGGGYGNVGFGNGGFGYGNVVYGNPVYGYGYPQNYGYSTPYNAPYNTPYYRGFNPYAGGYPNYGYSHYGMNDNFYRCNGLC